MKFTCHTLFSLFLISLTNSQASNIPNECRRLGYCTGFDTPEACNACQLSIAIKNVQHNIENGYQQGNPNYYPEIFVPVVAPSSGNPSPVASGSRSRTNPTATSSGGSVSSSGSTSSSSNSSNEDQTTSTESTETTSSDNPTSTDTSSSSTSTATSRTVSATVFNSTSSNAGTIVPNAIAAVVGLVITAFL